MNEILADIIEIKKTLVPTMEFRVTNYLPKETVQAKRHKRKSSRRWQKKWRKRFGVNEIPSNQILQIGNVFYMSPETEAELMKKVSSQIKDGMDRFFNNQNSILWNGSLTEK